jgi:CheY-like chemotaxis protein
VLLVEDDGHMAAMFLDQLRRDGIPLEHVASGRLADQFVRTRIPTLILMDLKLPDLPGRELIDGWAQDQVVGAIPIWIISNLDADQNLWWHNSPNVQRYFLKSRVALPRLSLEIRATLGLPYSERLTNRGQRAQPDARVS